MARDPRSRIDMKLHGVALLVGRVGAPRAGAIPNPIYPGTVVSMTASLCETCAFMREVVTPRGSRFRLCRVSQTDPINVAAICGVSPLRPLVPYENHPMNRPGAYFSEYGQISMSSAARAFRMAEPIAGAPGVSEWTHTVCATTGTSTPPREATVPCRSTWTTRCAMA